MEMNIWSMDFVHPLDQVIMLMTSSRMRAKLLLSIQLFGSTPIKQFGKVGSLKFLTVNHGRIQTI